MTIDRRAQGGAVGCGVQRHQDRRADDQRRPADRGGRPLKVTTINPGAMNSDLHASITIPQIREHAAQSMATAMPTETVARAILYVLDQPNAVAVNELTVRGVGDPF
jgi:NADP-dependent 3-hydroxy acid dehydrogenase YdfG